MAYSRQETLRRHGYLAVGEVQALLASVIDRMASLDEGLTREYVMDPFPGGIEHKVVLLCRRRKALLTRLAEQELARIAPPENPA
jgi:hypothetical protein